MSRGAGTRAPLPLVLAAGAVVALLLLPLAYLVVRVASGGRVLEILGEAQTWRLVWNTVLLAVGVVVCAVVVAVPLAWLVTQDRSSGPPAVGNRRSPPLRHPELRRRLLPARLLRRARDPRGRTRRRAPARDPGLLGIAPRAHARDLPVRVPAHAVRAPRARPVARGGGPRSRQLAEAHLPPRHRAGTPARGRPRRAARRAVHAVRLRRRLADELRHAHARDLRPVQEPLRPCPCGHAGAPARRADGDRARGRAQDPPARPAPSRGARHEAAAAGHRAGSLDGAGPRFLWSGRRPLPRPPGGRARVLAQSRHRERARVGLAVVGGRALPRCLRARGRRRRAGSAPRRRAGGALRHLARRGCSNGSRTQATPCPGS